MNYLAHMGDLLEDGLSSDKWDWGSPLGLGFFIVAIALTLGLLAWTIKTLSSIDAAERNKRK